MSQNAASNRRRRPGGKRLGQCEVALRVAFVEEQLAAGASRADVVAACAERFACAARTVDGYIAIVRERWAQAAAATSNERRQEARARVLRLCRVLEEKGAWGARVAAERLLADIDNVRGEPAELVTAPAEPHAEMSLEEAAKNVERASELFDLMRSRGLIPGATATATDPSST